MFQNSVTIFQKRGGQGLTLVHFSAQPEPFVQQSILGHPLHLPLHTLLPPNNPSIAPPIQQNALKLS